MSLFALGLGHFELSVYCHFADSCVFYNHSLNIFYFFKYLSYPAVLLKQGRRELSAVVHCYGGGSCKITINSATTAGEVRYSQREWCHWHFIQNWSKYRSCFLLVGSIYSFKGPKLETLFITEVVQRYLAADAKREHKCPRLHSS